MYCFGEVTYFGRKSNWTSLDRKLWDAMGLLEYVSVIIYIINSSEWDSSALRKKEKKVIVHTASGTVRRTSMRQFIYDVSPWVISWESVVLFYVDISNIFDIQKTISNAFEWSVRTVYRTSLFSARAVHASDLNAFHLRFKRFDSSFISLFSISGIYNAHCRQWRHVIWQGERGRRAEAVILV